MQAVYRSQIKPLSFAIKRVFLIPILQVAIDIYVFVCVQEGGRTGLQDKCSHVLNELLSAGATYRYTCSNISVCVCAHQHVRCCQTCLT